MTNDKTTVIAIDGLAGAGKGTLAKLIAKEFIIPSIDSGALYRCLTYILCPTRTFPNLKTLKNILTETEINWHYNKTKNEIQFTYKNQLIETFNREPWIQQWVSKVSALLEVREFVNKLLKAISDKKTIIVDGRDIGTCVFPEAKVKLFIIADINSRTQRRLAQYQKLGYSINPMEVQQNLQERDEYDKNREICPLKPAPDAFIIDNSSINIESFLQIAIDKIKEKNLFN